MRPLLPVLAALTLAGCSRPAAVEPPPAPPPAAAATTVAADPLTHEVWLRTDAGAAAGDLLVFLDSGSLLMTSCGEPYRISRWRRSAPAELLWEEDGEPIRARITALDGDRLQLEFQLRGGPETKRYRASRAASVCPDLPR